MNPIFNWLKDPRTQAVELIVTACAAIGALLLTWYFGRKSLTKKDLERVEHNTAATSGHLENVHRSLKAQEQRETLNARAQRVSISVSGYTHISGSMAMILILKDTDVALTRVALFNEADSLFGAFPCTLSAPLNWKATVPTDYIRKWYFGGTHEPMPDRRRVKLRVLMVIDGK